MADESIGSVKVDIVADYSKLSQGFQAAQGEAAKAGASIASSFSSAVSPADALTQATNRLKAAEAALSSEGAKMLAQVQPTALGFQAAQAALAQMNEELNAARAGFDAARQAASQAASATSATSSAAQQAATAQQTLAGATQAAAGAFQQQAAAAQVNVGATMANANAQVQAAAGYNAAGTAATGLGGRLVVNVGATMANANAQVQAAAGYNAAGTAATGLGGRLVGLYAVVSLLRRAFGELENIRESEMSLLHLSEATGVATQQLAQFQGMIGRAGGDEDKFGQAIVFLSRSIEQGQRGVKTMSDELQRLGVTAKDPIAAFFQIADTLHNTKDKSEALAAASRVLGRGETELIGIMGQGSAALREYYGQAEQLGKARTDAIGTAQKLTAVEAEVKAAFLEIATGALPVLTEGLKVVATAFSAINIVVKLVAQVLMHAWEGGIQGAKDFGLVLSDLAHGRWDALKNDAGNALTSVRDQFKSMTKDMERETGESVAFMQKLWGAAVPKATPGADNAFPEPKKTGKDTAAKDQMHAWQEELAARQAGLSASSDLDVLTISDEKRFWESKLATLSHGSDNYRAVLEKVGRLNLEVIRQRGAAEKSEVEKQAKEFREQLAEVMASVTESGGANPATAGLQFVQKALEAPSINEGALKAALEELPKLTAKAEAEDLDVMRRWVKASEAIFEEGGNRTAAEASAHAARMIAVLEQLGGMEDEIAAQQKRKRGADKQVRAETLKVSDLGAKGEASHAESGIQAEKVQLQAQYELQIVHTFEQQVQHARDLAALEERSLQLKVAKAAADITAANAAGDNVRATQATVEWLAADDAIRNHRLATEAKLAQMAKSTSFKGMIDAGSVQIVNSTITNLSHAMASMVMQTKGWGKEFQNVIKSAERQILELAASSAIKKLWNAIQSTDAMKAVEKGIGTAINKVAGLFGHVAGAAGKAAGATSTAAQTAAETANTAAETANTAAVVAETAGSVALTTGFAATAAALVASDASSIANTAALIALTAAVIDLTAVDLAMAFFADGGDPPVNIPSIVGERGPELFIPRTAGTIIPADKTKAMLARMQQTLPAMNLAIPDVPATAGGFNSRSGSSSTANAVTNHNTGNTGDTHFNIYGANNPREVMRQVADFQKRQTGKYSPGNS